MVGEVQWEGFPGGSEGRASARNAGDQGLIPGSGRSPGVGNDKPLFLLLPGKSQGQRSLVRCSSRGREAFRCKKWKTVRRLDGVNQN